MKYYPVVGTVKYKDKIFSLSIPIMAKIIERKMAQCTNQNCKSRLLYSTATKRMYAALNQSIKEDPWHISQQKYAQGHAAIQKQLVCRCGSPMLRDDTNGIKLYMYVDPRVETTWDLFHGLLQCDVMRGGQRATGILNLRTSGFRRYHNQRKELFVIIDDYDEFKNVVTTLHVKTTRNRGLKFTATWKLKALPTEEELKTAFSKYKLRQLADKL